MQEKIRTSSKIPTKDLEKMIFVSIEYAKATYQGPTLAQMCQKLKSIQFLAKKQFQRHNSINDRFIILKD